MSDTSGQKKTLFPEPWLDDHWYYPHDDVLDWFKRCIEEHPDLMDCPPKLRNRPGGAYEWYGLGVLSWFEDWFSQFKEWKEFDPETAYNSSNGKVKK